MNDKIFSLDEIRRIIAPVAYKYGVESVYLFGSYARGEANTTSDLDFLIKKGRLRGLQLAGMSGDLSDLFEKNVDLLTFTGLNRRDGGPDFIRGVGDDMVVVYEQ